VKRRLNSASVSRRLGMLKSDDSHSAGTPSANDYIPEACILRTPRLPSSQAGHTTSPEKSRVTPRT
jgi:hypothetical protein